MGNFVTVKVTNRQGVLANFVAKEAAMLHGALATVERFRGYSLAYAQSIVPVDTGRTRRSLRAEYVGAGKRVFVLYYDPAVYSKDGVVYYAVFLEYGTSRMAARPTLRLTNARMEKPFRQGLLMSMRRAA